MSLDFHQACEELQVNEELARNIDKKLFPLLEEANKIHSFNLFLIGHNTLVEQTTLRNFMTWASLAYNKIRENVKITPAELSTLFLMDYIIIVESIYTHMVDIVCFALVTTGKTLLDPRKCEKKEAVTFDDIRLVPLGTKLDFLRSNGFSMISDGCSVSLRNSAAHLSYTINDDGAVYLPNKTDPIDVTAVHDRLREAALCT